MKSEEEWEKLQAENAAQRERIRSLEELVRTLQGQLQEVRDQLVKDSHNSGLPPSSDRFGRQPPKSLRKKSGKKPGAQPGHLGHHLQMVSQPDAIQVHRVDICRNCAQDLSLVPARCGERRQVMELPQKRVEVIEHQVEEKVCPTCYALTRASFPSEVKAPIQYGVSIGALALYLQDVQLLPFARTSEILHDLLGVSFSPGTLQNFVYRVSSHLEGVEEQIKKALIRAEVIHQDETSIYVNGKAQWVHVCSTPQLTHYATHPKRGLEAMDAIGIAPHFQGTSVHDGFASYQKYPYKHAACNVHNLRDLTFVEEEHQQVWAKHMKELLLRTKRAVAQARQAGESTLPAQIQAHILLSYRTLLTEGFTHNPPLKRQPRGLGRNRASPSRNLLLRLETYQEQILRFMQDFAVPFDNNQAERDLRMLKVQQKISGGFRHPRGAILFCRLRGYLSTLRKQGLPLLQALEQTLQGHPLLPVFPSPSE
jgi:transposase